MIAATIDVPAGGAWFEGHFPGRPILPGVAELALATDALARETGRPIALQGIAFARLRQLVFPGDRLEISARELGDMRLRIDLKRGGELVANAEFVLGMPEAFCGETTASMASTGSGSESGFPGLDELLPHRAPMRFLTSILRETTVGLDCMARIPRPCALVSDGSAPPVAAIEAAAQAAAAWEALRRSRDAGVASPRVGYLVALREIFFFAGSVPAERDLLVSVRLDAAAPPLTHYRIDVSLEGKPVTRGTIATFLTA
jgi:predicted hotdog family 3-hydroxylacyl-ACP dehydratase